MKDDHFFILQSPTIKAVISKVVWGLKLKLNLKWGFFCPQAAVKVSVLSRGSVKCARPKLSQFESNLAWGQLSPWPRRSLIIHWESIDSSRAKWASVWRPCSLAGSHQMQQTAIYCKSNFEVKIWILGAKIQVGISFSFNVLFKCAANSN